MNRKPDYLVSICLVNEDDLAGELAAIDVLNAACVERLSYWELLYVIGETDRPALRGLADKFAGIANLRIIVVRDDVNYYWRRAVAAREAIGDVVVLTSFNELNEAELLGFAAHAMASERIVIGVAAGRHHRPPFAHWLLGLVSQFKVSARALKTIALPRNQLVTVLAHQTAPIELRFEPKRGNQPYVAKELHLARAGGETSFRQRIELVAAILSTSSARFLSMFAVLSAGVSALSVLFMLYAIGVILLRSDVQPGWFSTAISQGGSTAFLSIGLAVIALGIANMTNRLDGGTRYEILDEIGNISFSDRISDLNVETQQPAEKVETP